ncbi:MAG: DUF1285 domain-containing protein [Proteobacteria bacterium]|nr:DUF1285 domain-containing protein [Pseudomonadota bacterium]
MQDLPYSLMSELDKVKTDGLPPVHLWHPENEKDIDLVITAEGSWLYGGTPIKRPRLVRLFSSVLRREGDNYFLVTPVEKCRITVEDVPFQVVLMDEAGDGTGRQLTMTTDMGEVFPLDNEHPMRMTQQGDQWVPYVLVRDGMEARVSRNVYYQLAESLDEAPHPETGEKWLGVWSHDVFTPFMLADAAG